MSVQSQPGDSMTSTSAEKPYAKLHSQEDDPENSQARTGKTPEHFGRVMRIMLRLELKIPKVGDVG